MQSNRTVFLRAHDHIQAKGKPNTLVTCISCGRSIYQNTTLPYLHPNTECSTLCVLPAAAAVSPLKTFSFPEPSLTPSSLPSNKFLLQSCGEEEGRRREGCSDSPRCLLPDSESRGMCTAAGLVGRHRACKSGLRAQCQSCSISPCHSGDSQLTAIHHLCSSVCLSRNLLQPHPCFPAAGGSICLWSFELHSKHAHRSPLLTKENKTKRKNNNPTPLNRALFQAEMAKCSWAECCPIQQGTEASV